MTGGSVNALIALDEGVDAHAVQAVLPIDRSFHIVGVVDGLDESWGVLQEAPTDLLVVACAAHSDRALFLIDGAVKQRPERPVVVLTTMAPNGFFRRVFEAGADDIITLPEDPETVRFAFEKAMARKQGTSASGSLATSPLVCVLGPKGGTGKTLTTVNLAVALAREGKRVAVVDLDLQFGDVGLSLGLSPARTIYDLAKSGGSIDQDKLAGYLTPHPSGVDVMIAPSRPDHAGAITTDFLRDLYTALRSGHDMVVVDTPPGFTPEVIATVDASTQVCLVGMLDALSLKNSKLGLETLELMGYDRDRIRIVLNRADSRVGLTREDVRVVLGREADVLVPSDRDIPRSVNQGAPIVLAEPRSDAAKAFRQLARLYQPAAAKNGNGHNGRRLLRRKKA